MKLALYFPWKNLQNVSFFYSDEELISDAVKNGDMIALGRVFKEKPKFRSSIAYYLSKLATDEMLLDFIKENPLSISEILFKLALLEKKILAKFIVIELNGWVVPHNINMFINKFIEDTDFLKILLSKNLVKPSIIIFNHFLKIAQIDELLAFLTMRQLISILTDSTEDSEIPNKILAILKNKNKLETIFYQKLDSNNNTLLHLASPLIINKLEDLLILPKDPVLNSQGFNPLEYNVFTGNFAMVSFLRKFDFKFSIAEEIDFITNAIIYGLELCEDKYKYNAIAHIMKNANIMLPTELHYIHTFINNPKTCTFTHMSVVKPYLSSLVKYYLKRFSKDNDVLNRVQETMNAINHDFSLEVISHAGYMPEPLKEDMIVFRGGIGPLDEKFIKSFFDVGYHSSFVFKNGNKFNRNSFLNYDTKSSCIKDSLSRYEFSGNYSYFSENPYHSLSVYASNRIKKSNNIAFLIEARLEAGIPKIVGANTHELEHIVDFIEPYNIKFIYLVNENKKVINTFHNPNYIKKCSENDKTFFDRDKKNIDTDALIQSKNNNQSYYDNQLAKYKRPSSNNHSPLKFNKKFLSKFLEITHNNIEQHGFRFFTPSARNELYEKAYLEMRYNLSQMQPTILQHSIFQEWKRKNNQEYSEKCAASKGPGTIVTY